MRFLYNHGIRRLGLGIDGIGAVDVWPYFPGSRHGHGRLRALEVDLRIDTRAWFDELVARYQEDLDDTLAGAAT